MDFIYVKGPSVHEDRRKQLLKKYPELLNLMGPNPWSFVLILLFNAIQLTVAWMLFDAAWYWIVGAAYLFWRHYESQSHCSHP